AAGRSRAISIGGSPEASRTTTRWPIGSGRPARRWCSTCASWKASIWIASTRNGGPTAARGSAKATPTPSTPASSCSRGPGSGSPSGARSSRTRSSRVSAQLEVDDDRHVDPHRSPALQRRTVLPLLHGGGGRRIEERIAFQDLHVGDAPVAIDHDLE